MFKVYISGAIKNNPNYRQEFEMAEKNLRDKGFIPLNPCKTKAHLSGASEKECLFEAIALMREAQIMVQISPIEISEGMRIEQDIAKYSKIPIQNWILANKACTAEDIKKIADALIAKKERENIANQRDRILADVHICFWTDPAVMKAIAREIANKIEPRRHGK